MDWISLIYSWLNLILACLFTFLLVIIQLLHGAGSSLRALATWHTLLYLLIFLLGNLVATILAVDLLSGQLDENVAVYAPFLQAFAGVFSFQFIIGNTNISLFQKDVLAINDWITQAKQVAIQKAIERQIELDDAALIINTNKLSRLEEEQLKLYLKTQLDEDIEHIENDAVDSNIATNKYKAMILASSLTQSQLKAILNNSE